MLSLSVVSLVTAIGGQALWRLEAPNNYSFAVRVFPAESPLPVIVEGKVDGDYAVLIHRSPRQTTTVWRRRGSPIAVVEGHVEVSELPIDAPIGDESVVEVALGRSTTEVGAGGDDGVYWPRVLTRFPLLERIFPLVEQSKHGGDGKEKTEGEAQVGPNALIQLDGEALAGLMSSGLGPLMVFQKDSVNVTFELGEREALADPKLSGSVSLLQTPAMENRRTMKVTLKVRAEYSVSGTDTIDKAVVSSEAEIAVSSIGSTHLAIPEAVRSQLEKSSE